MAILVAERRRRLLGLSPVQWIMLGIAGLAVVYAALALSRGTVMPYTNVSEAKLSARSVQVFGYLHDQGHYDEQQNWVFDIQGENGDTVTVVYPKTKPANFEQAISVVATGKYDTAAHAFVADDLLVKCPSKYQEQASRPQS